MIVVDTSVLVEVLRHAPPRLTAVLWQLIDADLVTIPIVARQELRAGLAERQRPKVLELLSALPIAMPTDDTWRRIEGWTDAAAARGERFGLSDLMVAALAAELGALVWTFDRDFERLEALGFVRLFAVPAVASG